MRKHAAFFWAALMVLVISQEKHKMISVMSLV
jgi:hypothetical protein